MKISREIKTAVLVLSGIALFIYIFTFLKGENVFSNTKTFYTEFDYNALSSSSPVTIKGNRIGKVERISYNDKTGKTHVEFSVNPDIQFSKHSLIRLYETGIMGGNALAIIKAKTKDLAQPGDFIRSEIKPGLIASLEKDFSGIGEELGSTLRVTDTLLGNLNALVEDHSQKGLKSAIAELNTTLRAFKSLSFSVENLIKTNDKKIASVLENFDKVSNDLNSITTQLQATDIKSIVVNFNKTLEGLSTMLSAIKSNDGTIGKLLNDDALYNNLEAASKEMQLLLLDVKLHPARYRRILSKKEIPYQEPTEEQTKQN